MSQKLPEGRRGQVLAVILLLIAAMIFYLLFVHVGFVRPLMESRSRIAELRDQELDFRTRAQQEDKVKARLKEVRDFEKGNPGFLTEDNFDLAASALIQRLASAVDARKAGKSCQVTSRSPYRSRDEELFERVTIKVSMRCEMDHLLPVFYELETTSPQLFISDLNVSSRRVAPRQNQSKTKRPINHGYLDIRFDMYGYLRKKGKGND